MLLKIEIFVCLLFMSAFSQAGELGSSAKALHDRVVHSTDDQIVTSEQFLEQLQMQISQLEPSEIIELFEALASIPREKTVFFVSYLHGNEFSPPQPPPAVLQNRQRPLSLLLLEYIQEKARALKFT